MIAPERIWSSKSLPTLPSVAVRLLELSRDPDAEMSGIVEVIRADPAISAKLLRAANSSLFAFRSKITSIERAVPLLGITTATSLALSFSLAEQSLSKGPLAAHFQDYWRKSVVQGCAAELLGERIERGLGSEFFLVGLLLDIGRLVLLKVAPTEYGEVLERVLDERRELHEVERERLGLHHVEVGARILRQWQLPELFHLAADRRFDSLEELSALHGDEEFDAIRVGATASAIGEYFCGSNNGPALERTQQLADQLFALPKDELHDFVGHVRARVDVVGELFSVNTDDLGSPSDLIATANEHLAELALRAQVASSQAAEREQVAERERRELERRNRELLTITTHDQLTGLHNRAFFDGALDNEIARAVRAGTPVAVLFGDIDHFKTVNDTYGHKFGDEVLVRVGEALTETARKSDIVARYGGEEFVVLAVQTTENGLHTLCERLRETVQHIPLEHDGEPVSVTISIGASFGIPQRGGESFAERLMTRADEAMYVAKRGGRNRVEIQCLLGEDERNVQRLSVVARFSRWLVREGVFEPRELVELVARCQRNASRVGELAVALGHMRPEQVLDVLAEQRRSPDERFGEIARRHGLVDVEQLGWLLAQQREPLGEFCRMIVEEGLLGAEAVESLRQRYLATTPKTHPAFNSTCPITV